MPDTSTVPPITGEEAIADSRDPRAALAQFYRAFNHRDLGLMERIWEQSEEVAMDNPVGGISRGWSAIRAVYQRIFDGKARVTVEFFDYTVHVVGDVFIAVGRERGRLESRAARLDLAIRTTRVFRRAATGEWRQFHHHGSIDDPKLLAAYQTAVR